MAVLGNSVGIIEEGISAIPSDSGSATVTIFMLIVVLLVGMGAGAKRWFYPFTMDDLAREIELVWRLIEENSTRDWDPLESLGWVFRQRLRQITDTKEEIKNRSIVEPDRWHLRAWFVLQWREMKDVKSCYLSLMTLKKDVMTVIEIRKRQANQSDQSNIDNATATVTPDNS
ncbi:hypothetical protein PQX77_003240 [Marasmius sp. AFHP31]|nr:hypothetical protein PQX77_003240 [Marasmius sp. AFHP31]